MRKLCLRDILVSGMRGLGVEIAKNLVLAGPRSVTIHDTGEATWNDLSAQVSGSGILKQNFIIVVSG